MAVDEAGKHGPPAGVDLLVGGGGVARRADPGDRAAVDDQRGVGWCPGQVLGVRVVGDQLADVGDHGSLHAVGQTLLDRDGGRQLAADVLVVGAR